MSNIYIQEPPTSGKVSYILPKIQNHNSYIAFVAASSRSC